MCSAWDPTLPMRTPTHAVIAYNDSKQQSTTGVTPFLNTGGLPFSFLTSATISRAALSCALLPCAALSRAPAELPKGILGPVEPNAGALVY